MTTADPTCEALVHLLRDLETQLLAPATRRSRTSVSELLADDFIEFGASGRVFTKAAILDELASEPDSTLSISDFCLRFAGPASALVTYRVTRTVAHGDPRPSLRSSLWVFRDSRWQMLFHQGTTTSA